MDPKKLKNNDKLIYLGCSDEQVKFGNCDDPRAAGMVIGEAYTVGGVEVHSWHTKIFFEEFPDFTKGFNSVCFNSSVENHLAVSLDRTVGPGPDKVIAIKGDYTNVVRLNNVLTDLDSIDKEVDAVMESITKDEKTFFLRSELTEVNEKLIDIKKRILFVKYSLST